MHYVTLGCRVLLGTVFIVAIAGKLRGRRAFGSLAAWVAEVPRIPRSWARLFAGAALVSESGVVLALAMPRTATAGLAGAMVLLGLLTFVLLGMRRRGRGCHCFGASYHSIRWRHVARNISLIVICGLGLVTAVSAAASGPLRPDTVALTVVSAVVAGGLICLQDRITELFAR